ERAKRYRDERVPDQAFSRRLLTLREAVEKPGYTWRKPARRIAPAGKRLVRHKPGPRWSMARKYGPELVVYVLIQVASWLVVAGIGLTVTRLFFA
ncbi:MAG TPA: hypothetical protein VK039_10615, partial [Brevibacterium sp.]|nr:hypothetical protein [Brevibacterium sp.]